jgi:hypothetical protein
MDQPTWTDRFKFVSEGMDWVTRDENQLSVQMAVFVGGFITLYFVMGFCEYCVFGIFVFCIVTCLQYRLMNLLMWACIIVLWSHGWRINFGKSISVQWA